MAEQKKIVLLVFSLALFAAVTGRAQQDTVWTAENQLDVNRATYEQIARLPVDEQVARSLYEYVTYRGYLKSIYDLMKIDGIDAGLFRQLKPLIRIEPYPERTSVQQRIEDIYFRLDRWSSSEGINDALTDLWIEKALEPINVNSAGYDDLVNLQNMSPVDAVAIINYRETQHWLRDERDLRRAPGLSNYAYRSARNFLNYKDTDIRPLHGSVLMRVDNTPFMADEGEQTEQAGLSAISGKVPSGYNYLPNAYYRMRFTLNQNMRIGLSYTRNLNEPNHYLNSGGLRIPDGKFFIGIENQHWGDFQLRKVYLGNYMLTLGQGVIMENTDFFTPRKSGFGFRKRFRGLSGDNSRTRQYTLRGLAAEAGFKNWAAIGFISYDDRDAIINREPYSDELGRSFNQLIVLDQRFKYALDDSLRGPNNLGLSWLNSVKELTYGSHLRYNFMAGTSLGVTYYESAYDKVLDPNPYEVAGRDYQGNENWDIRQVTADSEIKQAYGGAVSRGSNPLWSKARSFRRIYGFDFQTVINNIAIQGEYGELDKGGSVLKMGDDPKALVVSAYLQYPTFNILALYRNYDVGFDNPYQRSFSNYRRYKGTIFEDYYYLQSALYAQLYENNPQPQAEEGFYINSYYQVTRQFTTRLEYDNWTRKADAASHYRLVGTIDYRPVYPIRIQLRQKWQSREDQNELTSNLYYKSLEFRGRLGLRLSNYDNLELLYANSKLLVHPRPRIFGDINLDAEAMAASLIHNFNQNLKLSGMLVYYKGFLWNFEDTQFVVMDSRRGALRYWASLYVRFNHHLSARLKYTADHHRPVNNIRFDAWDTTLNENPGKRFAAGWNRTFDNIYFFEFIYNF